MSAFAADITRFQRLAEQRERDTFVNLVSLSAESLIEGSPLTGAPGQPVDTGNLKGSFQTIFDSEREASIVSNCAYAPHIEDDVQHANYAVGGPHSLKLTVASAQRLAERAAADAGAQG